MHHAAYASPTFGHRPACQEQAQRCPCCGGRPAMAHLVTDRYGWKWSLHTCSECKVEYQARPMTPEAAKDFYASGRYRQLCAQVTGKPWDDPKYLKKAQEDYADNWLSQRFGYAGSDGWEREGPFCGRVLDYGGSTGVVSQAWVQHWCVAGGEGVHSQVTVADYGDGATTTPEQALAVPDGTYDAIICAQTLDHVRDPLVTLQAFLRVAKPGARLFVDVVKQQHTDWKIDHVTYFSQPSIFLALLERSGWSLVWLDGETNPTHLSALMEKPQ